MNSFTRTFTRTFFLRKSSLLLAISTALIASMLSPLVPANAADKGYRYWGYFQAAPGASTWTAAMTGPTVDIKDGAVEGWSFVFSSDDIPSKAPAVKASFTSICAKTKAKKGMKRIGLVVDFGATSYAPKGEKPQKIFSTCLLTATDSQGIDVLGQALKVRSDASGLICGLNGYPRKECGVEISTPSALLKK